MLTEISDLIHSHYSLADLDHRQMQALRRVNASGLDALESAMASNKSVAFVGAGASVPIAPVWSQLIQRLLTASTDFLPPEEAETWLEFSKSAPEIAADRVREALGEQRYKTLLQKIFPPRPLRGNHDPLWTPSHQAIVRANFRGAVTTNYDNGLLIARDRFRPNASMSGFSTWLDADDLTDWRTGEIFDMDEFPLLFAHGNARNYSSIVLGQSDYRRAYRTHLATVLTRLFDTHPVVWIGFGFSDFHLRSMLNSIIEFDKVYNAHHVAIMPWDPSSSKLNHPNVLETRALREFGSKLILYPALASDHKLLPDILTYLEAPEIGLDGSGKSEKPTFSLPVGSASPLPSPVFAVRHSKGRSFPSSGPVMAGRDRELEQLKRWSRDTRVKLAGVLSEPGGGISRLLQEFSSQADTPEIRQNFEGMFYYDFSSEAANSFASELTTWLKTLGQSSQGNPQEDFPSLHEMLRRRRILLVLDGAEELQVSGTDANGSFRDSQLGVTLTELARDAGGSYVVIGSHLPLTDLDQFVGTSVRLVDLSPLSRSESRDVLHDLVPPERWEISDEFIDLSTGNPLLLNVLANIISSERPFPLDAVIHNHPINGSLTERLDSLADFMLRSRDQFDILLIKLVSLFGSPVPLSGLRNVIHALSISDAHLPFLSLDKDVDLAVSVRLSRFMKLDTEGRVTMNPAVAMSIRRRITEATLIKAVSHELVANLPRWRAVVFREEARAVIQAIDLLTGINEWEAADSHYLNLMADGNTAGDALNAADAWRLESIFIGTPSRRQDCWNRLGIERLLRHIDNGAVWLARGGIHASAIELLTEAEHYRNDSEPLEFRIYRILTAASSHGALGDFSAAITHSRLALAMCGQLENSHLTALSQAQIAFFSLHLGHVKTSSEIFSLLMPEVIHQQPSENTEEFREKLLIQRWWLTYVIATYPYWPAKAAVDLCLTTQVHICDEFEWTRDATDARQHLASWNLTRGMLAKAQEHALHVREVAFMSGHLDLWVRSLLVMSSVAVGGRQFSAATKLCETALSVGASQQLYPLVCETLETRAIAFSAASTDASLSDPAASSVLRTRSTDDAREAWSMARRKSMAWMEFRGLQVEYRVSGDVARNEVLALELEELQSSFLSH